MKNFLAFLLLIGLATLMTQCVKEEIIEEPAPEVNYSCAEIENLCELTAANNEFGFRVFKKLHENSRNKNIFISPLSISTALSMTLNGAKGQTKTDMQNIMEMGDLNLEQINQTYKQLLYALPLLDNEIRLQLANSIWYKKGYPIRQEFLDLNAGFYGSEVNALDFSDPGAKDIINGWVNDKTGGLIESIVNQIPSNVVMYLINAIYFKGAWKAEFDPENTYDGPFYLPGNTEETVALMTYGGEINLPYFETENFQAVDLAYGDSIFSMSLFLPKETYSLDALIDDLSAEAWVEWANAFDDDEILLTLPRFKMEYEEKLNRALIDLGMDIAFSDAADFSAINGTGGLRIDEVRHKSFIEVNEEGTEAAAVTSVVIVETSVPIIPEVILNRPFLFVIRENKTNSVLFIGKMMNPNEN